ncbi:citrate lyase subunit beta/citryl-CoA lyase [Aestuariispira insulae]|uniref:Citrate lyase subunit beta/citryl-CoA lyase n=2 Tax=Aestuariispira insulae TaxID=1461337 RepID=A0A3D9HY37_9PROT|nr:citrate lyase subunit beta/citryl-CoA lyase [Aestuariispira insulae]
MPGSNPRALEKGRSLAADILIMDLEDSVTPDKKQAARDNIKAALGEGGYGAREIMVRVNHLDTDHGAEDIRQMAACGADALLMPKTEDAATLRSALDLMMEAGAPDHMKLWFMIETPKGILRAEEIAGASDRLGGIVLGTADLTKELHCLKTADRLPYLYSLGHCIVVARAYGLAIIDGPFEDLNDDAGFAAICQQSLEWGFDGKSLIHPKTIATANETFGPSPADIERAKRVISAFAEAEAKSQGVTLLDGQLVERLHVEDARRVLALAEKAAEIAAQSE